MNATLRRIGKPILEIALPQVERLTGFRTVAGDYLPHRLQMLDVRGGRAKPDTMFPPAGADHHRRWG